MWSFRYKLWILEDDLTVWQSGKTFIISLAVRNTSVLELLVTDVLWPFNSHSPHTFPQSYLKLNVNGR